MLKSNQRSQNAAAMRDQSEVNVSDELVKTEVKCIAHIQELKLRLIRLTSWIPKNKKLFQVKCEEEDEDRTD